jgi:hypothetical protein
MTNEAPSEARYNTQPRCLPRLPYAPQRRGGGQAPGDGLANAATASHYKGSFIFESEA